MGTGYIPFRKSAISSPTWQEYLASHPERAAVTEQAFLGFTYPNHPRWYSIRGVIGDMFEAVLLGDMTPEEALRWADETIEEEYLK